LAILLTFVLIAAILPLTANAAVPSPRPPREEWRDDVHEREDGTLWQLISEESDGVRIYHAWWTGGRDLPQPGEALAARPDATGWSGLVVDAYEGVERIIHSLDRRAQFERYEAIIQGDALEFYGTAVLIYANGHRTYPIHEIFADGERLTFFIDHSQGVMAEMYVQFRSVAGTMDTILFSFPVRADGTRGTPASSPLYLAEASVTSPFRLSRPAGTGSVRDIIVPNPPNRLPLGTISVARPTETPMTPPPTSIVDSDPTNVEPQPPAQTDPTPTPPTPTPAPTIEEPPSSWATESVERAGELGLTPEPFCSGFRRTTTRSEFAAIAVTLYEHFRGPTNGRQQFIDTSDSYVERAAYLGIVHGVGGGRFNPDASLTREQAAVMTGRLSAALGHPLPMAPVTFADSNEISSWALSAVGQMNRAGIMSGVGNNKFSPQGHFTIEQSIVTIMRLYDIVFSLEPELP